MSTAPKRSLVSIVFVFTFVLIAVCAYFEAHLAKLLNNYSLNSQLSDLDDSIKDIPHHHLEEKNDGASSSSSVQLNSCLNSQEWLDGTRLSNSNDGVSEEYIHQLIESSTSHDTLKRVVSPTICHASSNFTNPNDSNWDLKDKALEDEWHFRLLYMAIHHLFHAPAKEEMRARKRGGCDDNIASFDYECPSAKFLVAPYTKAGAGFGAAVRNSVVANMLDAIAMRRIPIFLNNVASGDVDVFLQKPSMLASCPRRDLQCFFMPVTPCTVTVEQLKGLESKSWSVSDVINDMANATDERIWVRSSRPIVPYTEANSGVSNLARKHLHDAALEIIDSMKKKSDDDNNNNHDKWIVLHRAALRILVPYSEQGVGTGKMYPQDENALVHAALLYFLRPNPRTREHIQTTVDGILPQDAIAKKRVLGIMIRGSDKCTVESECMPPSTYQEFVTDAQRTHKVKNVVLSSEDNSVLRYIVERNTTPGINYYYNKDDASPASGSAFEWNKNKIDSDSVMLSSLVVLKLQLHSNVVYGNCCSNFHHVLLDLYKHGCSRSDGEFHCMQNHKEARYRTCCMWSKSKECQAVAAKLRVKGEKLGLRSARAPKKAAKKK